jgi:transposase InsO family protein
VIVSRRSDHGIVCFISRKANCYDNAAVESFFGTLKQALVHHEQYPTRAPATASIFEYIEVFYNHQRQHSSIDYQALMLFKQHSACA